MASALDSVMVLDADWHVFDCPRCGAKPFEPCLAVTDHTHAIGTPMPKSVHMARRTGVTPAVVERERKSRSKPDFEYGDSQILPDVLDFRGARRELASGGGAEEVEQGSPLILSPEQTDRFWSKVRKGGLSHPTRPELGSCWWWMGPRQKRGKFRYGFTTINGERWSAHRLSFALTYRVPQHHVLHTCDRPGCVNPSHLYEGTAWDNSHDMLQRGRAKRFRTKSPTGYRGVSKVVRGYQARITVEGRHIYLGTYATAEEAARSYDRAAFKYHGAIYCASYPTYNFPEEWQ